TRESEPPRLAGRLSTGRLANGLRLCVLENRRAPVVSTALWFQIGTAGEAAGEGGMAHFLEHMMFKGARRFGPGEIDRVTQSLGGRSNAFTSHDATVYTFAFQTDAWPIALEIEADRLAGPTLDAGALERERRVVLEEIAMYENEPWDALEQEVHRVLYREHPYARPILGTRAELERHTPEAMANFFRRHYAPSNACLVVAGDVDWPAAEAAARPMLAVGGGTPGLRQLPAYAGLPEVVRVSRHRGDIARLLLAIPAPDAADPEYAACCQLALVLAGGRASRLHRDLVEEQRLCLWVTADASEAVGPGAFTLALEVTPGIAPDRVEAEVLRALDRLVREPPSWAEIARARRIAHADWVFAHERASQQGMAVGRGEVLFGRGWAEQLIERQLELDAEDVRRAAERLHPESGAVVGWSLPE
ncbi:MAG TPA: pitrilysin family protein, partial [Thermoanaerobaculia bacterium]|nr:pitrilysin family protein [Thermoanaerobaculia bacterium]